MLPCVCSSGENALQGARHWGVSEHALCIHGHATRGQHWKSGCEDVKHTKFNDQFMPKNIIQHLCLEEKDCCSKLG